MIPRPRRDRPRCARRLLLTALTLLVLGTWSPVVAAQPEPSPDAVDAFIQEQMDANRLPGLALAIIHDDEVSILKGYGEAGDGEPVTPRTQFYLASLSKSFTALAVMQLVEDGRIDLDEPVQAYLPGFTTADPAAAERITVRHLLNQTSGLADEGFPAAMLPQPHTIEERVRSLRTARGVSAPGTEFHYFNPNYEVLARIVEVTSGEPFSEYLQGHIFTPLGMVDTVNVVTSEETAGLAPRLAQGHVLAFGMAIPHQELNGYLGGSGGVISTAADMVNFLVMQGNGGQLGDTLLLSPERVATMQTPPGGIDSQYAMGWMVATSDTGSRVLSHTGVLSAFFADMVLLPDEGYGFVLLYNASYSLANYNGIKQGLIDLLSGQGPSSGGLSAGTLGFVLALLTIVTVALQVRGLRGLPRWAARTVDTPRWRLVPGIVLRFVPAVVLAGMYWLVETFTGRVFSYQQLFLALPDVMLWLAITAVLAAAMGVARLAIVARRAPG